MGDYLIDKEDGKIHTRYSELSGCTPAGAIQAVEMRTGQRVGIQTARMRFGEVLHDEYREESERTAKFPRNIRRRWSDLRRVTVDMVEHELAVEIYPGVVLHSRPDAICLGARLIADYKTRVGTLREARMLYKRSVQLKIYAYQMLLRGVQLKEAQYLIERWSVNGEHRVAYDRVIQLLTLRDITGVEPWIEERCKNLIAAIRLHEQGKI